MIILFTNWIKTSSITRYAVIGFSAFVLDFTLLKIGLGLGLHLLLANGLAVTFAIIYSYFMHRHFTFAHRSSVNGYRIEAKRQFVIFVVVSVCALGLSELLIHTLVVRVGYSESLSKVISSAVLFVWNYSFNRLLTFRSH